MQKRVIVIEDSVNYFGDTLITYEGNEYPVFQHNCSAGKRLLKLLESKRDSELVLLSNTIELIGETIVSLKPAIIYLKECIESNDAVNEIMMQPDFKVNNSAGAEIAGRYGY